MEKKSCPIEVSVSLLGNKWKPLIVYHLMSGTKRFSELKKLIPEVSQKVLTDNLRCMQEDGLVDRNLFAEVPVRVEYSLTDIGKDLDIIIEGLQNWGAKYQNEYDDNKLSKQ